MEIVHRTRFQAAAPETRNYDVVFLVGYAFFATALLIGMYFASVSAGIAPGDFASMVVFP